MRWIGIWMIAQFTFYCTADNGFEETSCSTLIEPPVLSIEQTLESQRVPRGSSITLTCSFLASPQPDITWYHRGRPIAAHTSTRVETRLAQKHLGQSVIVSNYRVPCVDESTVGEYFCVATSPCADAVATHALVALLAKPQQPTLLPFLGTRPRHRRATCDQTSSRAAPMIAAVTATRIELPQAVVQLVCRAKGNPTPVVTWQRMDDDDKFSSIDTDPRYMQLDNGDLLVVGDESVISESFRCVAVNTLGSTFFDSAIVFMSE